MIKIRKKRGHPPRHPVDTMRVIVWCHEIFRLTSMTAYQLEKRFHKHPEFIDEKEGKNRSKIWYKYRDGKTVPKHYPCTSNNALLYNSLIERVGREKWLESTPDLFCHILWVALKSPELSTRQINRFLCNGLGERIQGVLYKFIMDCDYIHDRRPGLSEFDLKKIVGFGNISSIATLVLLLREFENELSNGYRTDKTESFRNLLMDNLYAAVNNIDQFHILYSVKDKLFDYLISVYPYKESRINSPNTGIILKFD